MVLMASTKTNSSVMHVLLGSQFGSEDGDARLSITFFLIGLVG
jgi:hypothetical protein